VRILAVLAALALSASVAGCLQGDPGKGEPFKGSCPSWIKGLSTNVFQEGFQNSSMPDQKFDPQHPTGAGLEHFQNHTLDLVDLDFHPRTGGQAQALGVANGTLELRVLRSSDQSPLMIRDLATGSADSGKDVWTWGPGIYRNFTLQVHLAEPNEAPAPEPVLLRWDFVPDANPKSPSEAIMLYTAYFWYRTCSSDGTAT
jgi:hypothetical protein